MSRKRDELLYRKVNTLEEALEYIEKLKSRIRKNEGKLKTLRTENKTLNQTWDKTEYFLDDLTNGKPLSDVIKAAQDGKFSKENGPCPKCGRHTINKLVFPGFHIVVCEMCPYRARVDEVTS